MTRFMVAISDMLFSRHEKVPHASDTGIEKRNFANDYEGAYYY